jgi:endonuclease/exonuclease/phosphatase family metal-dependent hydrolase
VTVLPTGRTPDLQRTAKSHPHHGLAAHAAPGWRFNQVVTPHQAGTIRVATYNVRSLRDDRRAVARVLRDIDADIVCVQEAPRLFFWRRSCMRLARDAGLAVVVGGRAAAANLVLARPTIEVIESRAVIFSRQRPWDRRGAALARVRVGGSVLAVAGFHLDGHGHGAGRVQHITELSTCLSALTDVADCVVLAGDVNDEPDSPAWSALTAIGSDAFVVAGKGDGNTASPARPSRRIDALFVGEPATVLFCWTITTPDVQRGSDHCPVVADIHEPAQADRRCARP